MSEARAQNKESLLQFLRTIQKAGMPVESLGENDRLVASGLIDSLAILQIVTYLESSHSIDFSLRGVDPEQLGSIANILDLIEQEKS